MVRFFSLVVMLAMGCFSLFMFHDRYWRVRGLFNEEGRYFDPVQGIVFHSQSGIGWGSSALLCFSVAIFILRFKR